MKARTLTFSEVNRLLAVTKGSRNETRDRCLLLLMFRHGLRVSEASASPCPRWWTLKAGFSTCSGSRKDSPPRTPPARRDQSYQDLAERACENGAQDTDAFFVSERRGPMNRKTAWLAIRTYGDGLASQRIIQILSQELTKQ